MEEYKDYKDYKKDIDIFALVELFLKVLVDVDVNKQKGQNIVLTNGNNNEVQIPNEEGFGSNIQV